ncbi:MAG: M20/M25/M40 family metallo-hydrolase [Gemmatimonadales bacterium]|nr:M20/M25/M40 family metallo-hydrolase [Gemmatimonadales bacterium]
MPRNQFGASLLLATAVMAIPAALQAQRPGGGRGGPPPVDSSLYVRTTPPSNPMIQKLWDEGMNRSQVMTLAQVLLDSIGPRLTNSDRFDAGQQWLVETYAKWGVPAERQQYGTWEKWERGISHIDLIAPRVRSLEGMMLGWSPSTNGPVEADVVLLPDLKTPDEFAAWMPSARGKIVLTSPPNPSCRMPAQYEEFGQEGAAERVQKERADLAAAWRPRTLLGGNPNEWPKTAGVAAVISTNWSRFPGVNKIFGTPKQQVPTFDLSCEDYNLVFRLAENGQGPRLRINGESRSLGEQPVHNVIATIKGSEKPNEYIIFSAHYDSWDGASGATDNGTGTLTMLEALRILKTVYPNPKRTIIVGHWGGEEQGLNGSRSFVEDHPEIVARVHAGFNQDNGTGRIIAGGPGPFVGGNEAWIRYLRELPAELTGGFRLSGNSGPAGGGTDHAAFQCAKSPVYGVNALGWDYFNTTWHTNRDTYDKVVPEDLKHNATMIAMLAFMADQDPALLSREVITMQGDREVTYSCPLSTRRTADSNR